jgi:hypothetical protein
LRAVFLLWLLAGGSAMAQNCPAVDLERQKAKEAECRAAGGQWSRFADCEHLCVTNSPPQIGAEAMGQCTAVKTRFGCFTHVVGGRIVGRVCLD